MNLTMTLNKDILIDNPEIQSKGKNNAQPELSDLAEPLSKKNS